MRLRHHVRPFLRTAKRVARRDLRVIDLGYARRISYSQFGEDLWLADRFAETPNGFYVDVGAYHPFNASNTLLLYRRGWRGINIEPDPDALLLLRRFRRRDINLGVAIDATPGHATLHLDGSFTGLVSDPPDRGRGLISVPTAPLADILDRWAPTEIDLLDVDCEGRDLEVLRSNDWARFRPTVVLAESHDPDPVELSSLMSEVGYRHVAQFHVTHAFERVE